MPARGCEVDVHGGEGDNPAESRFSSIFCTF